MNKQEAKKRIRSLIEKYELLTPAQRKGYNESMTCRDFIEPLFEILGWDIHNITFSGEVTSEKQVSGKRVDYAFHVDGVTKFFLEAKKIEVDLREEKWAEQAVMYAWHKSVPWAILTDFESIKVFNAEWDEPDPERSLIFEIPYKKYLTDKRLWFLSKKSFEKGELDKYAEENFKKPKRESIDKQLAADLIKWREDLFRKLKGWNSKVNDEKIAKSVQKLLNRLIFIRTTEDRNIEDEKLREIVRNWKKNQDKTDFLWEELKKLFQYYWDGYDSRVFKKHICDALEYQDDFLAEVIKELYKNPKGIRYDFASIPADVFGTIYEQYLGKIQQEKTDKKSSKRKSQGIYYTPRYIVDYIVKNTLGEILKDKPAHEAIKIKVLDPACGSGSFLIKAFEILDNHIKAKSNQLDVSKSVNYTRKISILTANIFGVDLDDKAVEFAQLNLLLKALEYRKLLPDLSYNVKCGNSLISGTEKELKKYFGKDWKKKKPFNWQKEFPDAFKQGGFDVIIGNPPYIFARGKNFTENEKKYYHDNFSLLQEYQLNTYLLFIELSVKLLNKGGYFGFIIPSNWLTIDTFSVLRKFLIEKVGNLRIINIYDNVFEGVNVDSCILIFRKTKPNRIQLGEFVEEKMNIIGDFSPEVFRKNDNIVNISSLKSGSRNKILVKIEKKSLPLIKFATVSTGLKSYQVGKGSPPQTKRVKEERTFHSKKKKNNTYEKYLEGRDVIRYRLGWSGEYLSYGDWLAEPRKSIHFDAPRILVRQIPSKLPYAINAVYVKDKFFNDINSMVVFDFKEDPLYLLVLLNSKIISYWFANTFGKLQRKIFPQFKVKELSRFLIYKINFSDKKEKAKRDELVKLADEMLELNKEFQKLHSVMDEKEYKKIELEIQKTDKIIDQKVYKLYGLTKEEIKIIESKNE